MEFLLHSLNKNPNYTFSKGVSLRRRFRSTKVFYRRTPDNIHHNNNNSNSNNNNAVVVDTQSSFKSPQENVAKIVTNPCNVQMISEELHRQLFPKAPHPPSYDQKLLIKCKKHLQSHNLWGQTVARSAPVNFELPPLEGEDINSHFHNIAQEQTKVYRQFLEDLTLKGIPEKPDVWVLQAGWTKYTKNEPPISVPYPEGQAFVFDIEVCQDTGQVPTLATAVTTDAWYAWCSPLLVSCSGRNPEDPISTNELIPFETCEGEDLTEKTWTPKIIVGHNVSYDRARIKEQYFLEETKTRFLDTMSMHIAISGITSFQRAIKITMNSRLKDQAVAAVPQEPESANASTLDWNDTSSLNNLSDVFQLYCQGQKLEKETRNLFVDGKIPDIVAEFQNVMNYCARDVVATHQVLTKILPLFFDRFPHPATFAGSLEMGTAYLPINSNWNRYITRSEESYHNLEKEVRSILVEKAKEALELIPGEKYKQDPWLWDLDWKITKTRKKKAVDATKSVTKSGKARKKAGKKGESQAELPSTEIEAPIVTASTEIQIPVVATSSDNGIPDGIPAWYKKLFYRPKDPNYQPGPTNISTSMQVVPKLLRLCWFGFPLYHTRKGGWGFLVKKVENTPDNKEKLSTRDSNLENDGFYNFVNDTASSENEACEEASDGAVDETASKFPYEQWERIWEENKARLIREHPSFSSKSNVDVLGNQMRNNKEDSVQDLRDFMKGLETLTNLGLQRTTSKKDRKIAELISPHPKVEFRPLPHKDGANYKVGSPLAKDFLNKIEDNILTCANGADVANRVVRITKMLSYWRNNRDRIMRQIAVWLDGPNSKTQSSNNNSRDDDNFQFGAILPQVVVSGTLTRRAVEPTWMTASNAYVDRIGSELKGMVQAPPNYHFVGADVDSQELWIASVIGDADFARFHGCTALGWMTLQGSKSAGTDMHSKTASLIGIDRDQAKVLNYGRIYGAGVMFAERLLMQFNHQLSSADARTKARAMYKMTKGEKKYILNEEGLELARGLERFSHKDARDPYSRQEMQYLLRNAPYTPNDFMELVEKTVWDSGTESPMFNRLEEIAQEDCPRTPLLHCSISRSLLPSAVQNDFMTSRVNWVVQSSAVDYLHLMLTCMRWLFEKYDIKGRFSISVHDEVRFLVRSEDRYRAAMALQITNLFTRAMCSHQLGMCDLPQSVAFFSCVDIDKVLRKEVTQDCKTPSNPEGLWKEYGIPQGEAMDIYALLNKTQGKLHNVPDN